MKSLVYFHQRFYSTKLDSAKPKLRASPTGSSQNFADRFVSIYVDRLIRLLAIEIEPIGAVSQDSWHAPILPNCESFRTGIH
jgi:hypothetical protein